MDREYSRMVIQWAFTTVEIILRGRSVFIVNNIRAYPGMYTGEYQASQIMIQAS